MKQRKSVQYTLMVLSIIIYGAIASKVWSYFNTAEKTAIDARVFPKKELGSQYQKDTFSLNLNYPDPFTNSRPVSRNNSPNQHSSRRSNKPAQTPMTKELKQKIITAPNIIYQGYSINNNKISRVRLQIDGKGITFKLYEDKLGVLLSSITKDSIIVQKQGHLFTFFRK